MEHISVNDHRNNVKGPSENVLDGLEVEGNRADNKCRYFWPTGAVGPMELAGHTEGDADDQDGQNLQVFDRLSHASERLPIGVKGRENGRLTIGGKLAVPHAKSR